MENQKNQNIFHLSEVQPVAASDDPTEIQKSGNLLSHQKQS